MSAERTTVALECQKVVKKFPRGRGLKRRVLKALNGASLTLHRGELFGLLGPNGAGKTTLVRCIATLLIPDEGKIRLFGHDVFKDPLFCRQQIGLLTSGERTLYWKLSARDNLKFFAALYGLSGKERDRRIEYLLELLGLKEVANERLERYSSGMKQKVSLARAMIHNPDLLLLDEPTLGLDPQFGRFIRQFIKEELNQRQGKTILLTTHYMDEADELCERIAFINRGQIVDTKRPEEFKRDIPHKEVLSVRCQGEVDSTRLQSIAGVERLSVDSRDGVTTVKILASRAEGILSDVIEMVRTNSKILTIDVQAPTLEDVFIYMTGTSLTADTKEE